MSQGNPINVRYSVPYQTIDSDLPDDFPPMCIYRYFYGMKNLPGRFLIASFLFSLNAAGQASSKVVNQPFNFWTSINGTYRLGPKWGLQGDVHIRRSNGIADPGFYLARGGVMYWLEENLTLTAGYGYIWTAPVSRTLNTWGHENRLHQQVMYTVKSGKVGVAHRLRNELRWQQVIVNDQFTGRIRFSDRVRYQIAFNIPIFRNPKLPELTLSDELMVNFGKSIVYNTFDQNRLFIGFRQNISKSLSYDLGYMNVFQQRFTGFQYDMYHTLRLFFFYNGKRGAGRKTPVQEE